MLDNLKVGQKIFAVVMLVGAVLAVSLVVSYLSFLQLSEGLDQVRQKGMPNALIAQDMQLLIDAFDFDQARLLAVEIRGELQKIVATDE